MDQRIIIVGIVCGIVYIYSIYFQNSNEKHIHRTEKRKSNLNDIEKTLDALKSLIPCNDKKFKFKREARGDFWVLWNYVRAEHGPVRCYETVTLTTHSTIDFIDHLPTLVNRWRAPISLAIHAPGTDFQLAIDSIKYFRYCLNDTELITEYVTYHIFFSVKHLPKIVPNPKDFLYEEYECPDKPPYSVKVLKTYMQRKRILYPVNIARNIARDAAMTHYFLSSDIDYYPSVNLVPKFLKMIARNAWPLNIQHKLPRVFPLARFEVIGDAADPLTKAELQKLLATEQANPLDEVDEKGYGNIPKIWTWAEKNESQQMDVFYSHRLALKHKIWSPVFIGTDKDPYFDERLSWEGQYDRLSQAYIMCISDYVYMTLSDAFLVHSRMKKAFGRYINRDLIVEQQASFFNIYVGPQLRTMYGSKSFCNIGF